MSSPATKELSGDPTLAAGGVVTVLSGAGVSVFVVLAGEVEGAGVCVSVVLTCDVGVIAGVLDVTGLVFVVGAVGGTSVTVVLVDVEGGMSRACASSGNINDAVMLTVSIEAIKRFPRPVRLRSGRSG